MGRGKSQGELPLPGLGDCEVRVLVSFKGEDLEGIRVDNEFDLNLRGLWGIYVEKSSTLLLRV